MHVSLRNPLLGTRAPRTEFLVLEANAKTNRRLHVQQTMAFRQHIMQRVKQKEKKKSNSKKKENMKVLTKSAKQLFHS